MNDKDPELKKKMRESQKENKLMDFTEILFAFLEFLKKEGISLNQLVLGIGRDERMDLTEEEIKDKLNGFTSYLDDQSYIFNLLGFD